MCFKERGVWPVAPFLWIGVPLARSKRPDNRSYQAILHTSSHSLYGKRNKFRQMGTIGSSGQHVQTQKTCFTRLIHGGGLQRLNRRIVCAAIVQGEPLLTIQAALEAEGKKTGIVRIVSRS